MGGVLVHQPQLIRMVNNMAGLVEKSAGTGCIRPQWSGRSQSL